MSDSQPSAPPTGHRRFWPEFLVLGQKRIAGQVRMLGLSFVVGIVAGLAAIVFYVAIEASAYYALDIVAGYRGRLSSAAARCGRNQIQLDAGD